MPENTPPTDAQGDETLTDAEWSKLLVWFDDRTLRTENAHKLRLKAVVNNILADRARPVPAATHTDTAAQAGAQALRDAADEMEAVIADGDVAEVSAGAPGEVGRWAAVSRRDELYEEPHTWLRDRADRLAAQAPAPTPGQRRDEVNRVSRLLIAEWERIEGPVTPSYVASFADLARVVIADRGDA